MDVRLPDGTVIQNVPDGISKADLTAKLKNNGYDVTKLAETVVTATRETPSEIPEPRAEVPAWARQYPRLYGVAGAARETLGPLLEMGGMIGGGLTGATAGTFGAGPVGTAAGGITGASLGYSGAKEINRLADIALGNVPPQAPGRGGGSELRAHGRAPPLHRLAAPGRP
jgi:hypothetical protein